MALHACKPGVHEAESCSYVEILESKPKSDHQREMARLHQYEKRKMDREDSKQKRLEVQGHLRQDTLGKVTEEENLGKEMEVENNGEDTEKDGEKMGDDFEEDDTWYELLYLAYNKRPELRQQLPPASRDTIERYLLKEPLTFKDSGELSAFLTIKLREVLFLKRELKNLPDKEARRKREYEDVLKRQILLCEESEASIETQSAATTAQHRLRVMRQAIEILPTIISDADSIRRGLKRNLKMAKDIEGKMQHLESSLAELELWEGKVDFWGRASRDVIPGSLPYKQVVSHMQSAQVQLDVIGIAEKESMLSLLASLKSQYAMVLASPVTSKSTR